MWLMTEALRIFFEIIPRIKKVCADERWVLFWFWDSVKVLFPWLHFYIPLFHKIEVMTISRRSINLKKQSLQTKDWKKVMIESSCFFRVYDIKKALVDNHDVRDIIEDIVLSNIKSYIMKNKLSYIMDNSEEIEESIVEKSKEYEGETWIKVLAVRITDIAPCIHLNNIRNITYSKAVMD